MALASDGPTEVKIDLKLELVMWKRVSTRDSFLNNWNGIVSRGFVEIEFSLLFQVS